MKTLRELYDMYRASATQEGKTSVVAWEELPDRVKDELRANLVKRGLVKDDDDDRDENV